MGTTLLLIDTQSDFIDDNTTAPPALPVKGSTDDMDNLIDLIDFHGNKIDRIVATLCQHPPNHIAHAVMWLDRNDQHPSLFTVISDDAVKAGYWRASDPANQNMQATYVEIAAAAGDALTIWYPHCIIGSYGATIYEPLMETLRIWWRPGRELLLFPKGGFWCSEHFSAFKAAVQFEDEPSTLFNGRLLNAIMDERVLIGGEARGHCVAATVMDAVRAADQFDLASRMVLLSDCTSDVAGFETRGDDFVAEFQRMGGTVALSTDIFPQPLDTTGQ